MSDIPCQSQRDRFVCGSKPTVYTVAKLDTATLFRLFLCEVHRSFAERGWGENGVLLTSPDHCPRCLGTGGVTVYDSYHGGTCGMECDDCKGTGERTEEHSRR